MSTKTCVTGNSFILHKALVYARGRTYIDVSLSCLYGVPLVYARGRTHIDRALVWLG